jgi:hypothetical protein
VSDEFELIEDWRLEKSVEGVTLQSAAVKGSNFRASRVEAMMRGSLNTMLTIQRNPSRFPDWIDGVKESRLIDQGENFYVTHTIAPAPWPVKDRDSVVRSVVSQDPDTLAVTVRFHSEGDDIPPSKGCERVRSVKGFWFFMPRENGQLHVVYQNHVEPGGSIPAMLANRFALDVPFNTVRALAKEIQKPMYAKASGQWVKERETAPAEHLPEAQSQGE